MGSDDGTSGTSALSPSPAYVTGSHNLEVLPATRIYD